MWLTSCASTPLQLAQIERAQHAVGHGDHRVLPPADRERVEHRARHVVQARPPARGRHARPAASQHAQHLGQIGGPISRARSRRSTRRGEILGDRSRSASAARAVPTSPSRPNSTQPQSTGPPTIPPSRRSEWTTLRSLCAAAPPRRAAQAGGGRRSDARARDQPRDATTPEHRRAVQACKGRPSTPRSARPPGIAFATFRRTAPPSIVRPGASPCEEAAS